MIGGGAEPVPVEDDDAATSQSDQARLPQITEQLGRRRPRRPHQVRDLLVGQPDLRPPVGQQTGVRRGLDELAEAAPGTWLSGPERVAVAREARAARTFTDADTELPALLTEAAQSVSAAAALITREWVAGLGARGLATEQYVEVVGIVSRLAAVDCYVRGVGSTAEPLPDPLPGEPARERNGQVRWRNAFVPTHPEDGALYALSAVPAEELGRDRLHAQLYLSTEQMADLACFPPPGGDRSRSSSCSGSQNSGGRWL